MTWECVEVEFAGVCGVVSVPVVEAAVSVGLLVCAVG